MWELDCEESWAPRNWCFWSVVLEKTLESPLDCKEIQPVHSKGDQSWVFIGRTDAEAETLVLWPPHAKSWLIGKDSDAGRGWGQEEKGTTEDEMAGWHHRLDGHEFGWIPGVGDGQGGLVWCNSWGRNESDTTERLNWTELFYYFSLHWVFFVVHGLSPDAALGLLMVASVAGHGLQSVGSVVVYGHSCLQARGLLPDQGSNPCTLHWQEDSYPLDHQGSPPDV